MVERLSFFGWGAQVKAGSLSLDAVGWCLAHSPKQLHRMLHRKEPGYGSRMQTGPQSSVTNQQEHGSHKVHWPSDLDVLLTTVPWAIPSHRRLWKRPCLSPSPIHPEGCRAFPSGPISFSGEHPLQISGCFSNQAEKEAYRFYSRPQLLHCCCLVAKSDLTLCDPTDLPIEEPQAPLSVGFPRQEYWSGLLFPSPGDLPDPGIECMFHALAAGFFITEPPGKP